MSGSKVFLFLGKQLVGTVSESQEDQSLVFQYDQQWQKTGFALSPVLNFQRSFFTSDFLIFLENFLPEGQALDRLSILNSISKNNVFALALAIKNDLTGALSLSFSPTNVSSTKKQTLRKISTSELIERLENPDIIPMDIWDNKPRLSVAGMQSKLNVLQINSEWFLVDGPNIASNYLLKFESPAQKNLLLNEFLTMQLATCLDQPVAKIHLGMIENHRMLEVERFDRKIISSDQEQIYVARRYMIDGCQACGVPSSKKYERNFGDNKDVAHIRDGVSFSKLWQLRRYAKNPIVFENNLLDWMFFNLIVGNCDAHGKNVSFFLDHQGLSVTPWYDLISVLLIPSVEHTMAFSIGDEFELGNVHALQILYEAQNNGIAFERAFKRLSRIVQKLESGLEILHPSDDWSTQELEFFQKYKQFLFDRIEYWKKELEIMPELMHDLSLF